MLIKRRSLLWGAALVAAPTPAWATGFAAGAFTHGVASGDPAADSVILWTRFAPRGLENRIGWEVAEDDAFTRVVARGETQARFANDFCAKVEAGGLAPGRPYFDRFLSGSGPSETGRTRTAPAGAAESLSIAVFSCANFPFGYFHAYAHAAAREDIDLVIHTGDYIYEIQRGAYPSAADTVPGRIIDPTNETVTLADYYQRYATYHTDAGLLALRRAKPMSVVWDDHEFANDTWREGAQAHQTPTEGAFADRAAAAAKAYFDWMPIRRPDPASLRLYRSLDWGDLARLVFVDARLIGRDRQLDYRNQLNPALAQQGADAPALVAQFRSQYLDDPKRSMLGAAQERWFAETLAQSKQRGQPWQIIAQQVVVAEQRVSQDILRLLPEGASAGTRQWFVSGAQMTALGLPWNLDSWNGYPVARARFIHACAAHANNAMVLGGDTHNCWLSNVPAASGQRLAALEFAGGSVASPGAERSLSNAAPGERETLFRDANPGLAFCDVSQRGYGALRFTRAACESEWIAFDSIASPIAPAPRISRIAAETSATGGPGGWSV